MEKSKCVSCANEHCYKEDGEFSCPWCGAYFVENTYGELYLLPERHRVHEFSSTHRAYDACQCDARIANGDTLHVPSEKVVGVANTWPFAVTKAYGELHTPAKHVMLSEILEDDKYGKPIGLMNGMRAIDFASNQGYDVLPEADTMFVIYFDRYYDMLREEGK